MTSDSNELSADEIALYDRQLRLWGIEAQNRMRKARVLLITMKALGNEVAKNLALAGIGSLTVLDPEVVSEEDIESEFFIGNRHLGRNRAEASVGEIQQLNPRVQVQYESASVHSKDQAFFQTFDVVIATDAPLCTMILLNKLTRPHNIPFYAAWLYGLCGIVFVDLVKHTFLVTHPTSARDSTRHGPRTTQRTEIYCPLPQSLSTRYGNSLKRRQASRVSPLLPLSHALLSWLDSHRCEPSLDDQDEFSQLVGTTVTKLSLPPTICTSAEIKNFIAQLKPTNLSGVAAVAGGLLSQDVLNTLGGRELPIKNWLIFDGEGKIYNLLGDLDGVAQS